MLLTKTQAEHVYSAMAALNNIGGHLSCTLNHNMTQEGLRRVVETANGAVLVYEMLEREWEPGERYVSQASFADAYDLT